MAGATRADLRGAAGVAGLYERARLLVGTVSLYGTFLWGFFSPGAPAPNNG